MTAIQRYTAALHPDLHRVLGRRLVPLTVGHLLLLTRLDSPLVGGAGRIDEAAIALVVGLCSRPYPAAVRWLASRRARRSIWWLGIRARVDLAARFELSRYLQAGADGPRWWTGKDAGQGTSRVPFWLGVQVTLMRELGLTSDQALCTPAAVALWQCAAVWESTGVIQLVSDDEIAVLDAERAGRASVATTPDRN